MRLFFSFFFFRYSHEIYFENISIVIDSIDLSGFFGICRFLNNNTIKIKNLVMGGGRGGGQLASFEKF